MCLHNASACYESAKPISVTGDVPPVRASSPGQWKCRRFLSALSRDRLPGLSLHGKKFECADGLRFPVMPIGKNGAIRANRLLMVAVVALALIALAVYWLA